MPKTPSEPAGDTPDAERGGAALLARRALGTPDPPPQAERASRERVLAQFQSGALSPRPLQPDQDPEGPAAPAAWPERVARVLRRMLGR